MVALDCAGRPAVRHKACDARAVAGMGLSRAPGRLQALKQSWRAIRRCWSPAQPASPRDGGPPGPRRRRCRPRMRAGNVSLPSACTACCSTVMSLVCTAQ